MPIINLDDPTTISSLVYLNVSHDIRAISDNVVLTTMYSIHTIVTRDNISGMMNVGGVVDVSNTKYEIIQIDRSVANSHTMVLRGPTSSILPFAAGSNIRAYEFTRPIPSYQQNIDSITYNVQNNLGIYLYLDYTKGIETDVRMYFTIKDHKQRTLGIPNTEYALMIVTDPTGLTIPYNLQVNTSGTYVMPVNIPEPVEFLTVNFAYTGSTSTAGGALKVFANTDKNYYV